MLEKTHEHEKHDLVSMNHDQKYVLQAMLQAIANKTGGYQTIYFWGGDQRSNKKHVAGVILREIFEKRHRAMFRLG